MRNRNFESRDFLGKLRKIFLEFRMERYTFDHATAIASKGLRTAMAGRFIKWV